ncbi:MAG: S41 family peptidase, partial [Defluviitaleaceae bacterium]|nr:S41 family peptidase [Defluviitaleaceae bacterium]
MDKYKSLKGILTLLILASTLFVMSGCQNQNNQTEYRLENGCRYLYDFNYLITFMEDTSPYFGVVYRNSGVDIRQTAVEAMERIASNPDMDESILFDELFDLFIPLMGIAHALILDYSSFHHNRILYGSEFFANNNTFGVGNLFSIFSAEALESANSIGFYQRQTERGWKPSFNEEEFFSHLFESWVDPSNFPAHPASDGAVATYIIEEGRIAYMNIPSFFRQNSEVERANLFDFYAYIQEYEHLIIDIRNNTGGFSVLWENDIMLPLGGDLPSVPLYTFFSDSEMGQMFARMYTENHLQRRRIMGSAGMLSFMSNYPRPLPIAEFAGEGRIANINQNDLQNLGYVVPMTQSVGNLRPEWYVPNVHFQGQIWLLINPLNGSSSSLFARHAKDTGFATLVGEQTSGNFGGGASRIFISLPNTGIVATWDTGYKTDIYGNSWEEFRVTPHYENRQGLDALQTALWLI